MDNKKYTPILDKYYDFCKNGIPGNNGLCFAFEYGEHNELFQLIRPQSDDLDQMRGKSCTAYWGDEGEVRGSYEYERASVMTPLRQNIVLLMACLNGEL